MDKRRGQDKQWHKQISLDFQQPSGAKHQASNP